MNRFRKQMKLIAFIRKPIMPIEPPPWTTTMECADCLTTCIWD